MLLTQLGLLFQLAAAPAPAEFLPGMTHGYAPVRAPADSILETAREALDRGRPWQASLLVAPVVGDSSQRTPSAVLLAATAASRWGGWPEVGRLLQGETWLDSLFDGGGRVLLARSALERGEDSLALANALAAPRGATAEAEGERLFLLASALDRVDALDSAAATYRRAAALMPVVADWILLKAAAVTADSLARAGLYERIGLPLARERIRWTDAAARERAGDLEGAADRYQELGARLTAVPPSPDPGCRQHGGRQCPGGGPAPAPLDDHGRRVRRRAARRHRPAGQRLHAAHGRGGAAGGSCRG
jgi:hypothetical protein